MKIVRTVAELRAWRKSLPPDQSIGFIPTMGALHEGHLSLVRLSKNQCQVTVVSIFVNPIQFGPKEDLSRYPRPFENDVALLEKEGVDFLFAPEASEFYPKDFSTYVNEESVSQPLCGSTRPGHFRGVTTVVLRLFNLVQPDRAFFGQKDAQQCAVIEKMVHDLNIPVEIQRGPTIRESDGLAMSSRNAYLSAEEREIAPRIYRSLLAAQSAFEAGKRDAHKLTQIGRSFLEQETAFRVQYWEIRHPRTLQLIEGEIGPDGALIAVAAYLGNTRLIDNLLLP